MRVVAYPANGYYARFFYAELKRQEVPVIEGDWSGRWMRRYLKKDDVAHLHWPSFYYKAEGRVGEIILAFIRFLVLLVYLRFRCRAVVWTAHNLFPHERCRIPVIDVWVRWLVIKFASLILVHGVEAKNVLVERFPIAKRKCAIIPFGNWAKAYPSSIPKRDARSKLALPDSSFIYLAVGRCRPYKNIEVLVTQFREVASHSDRLIVAGAFSGSRYLADVKNAAGGDERILIHSRFLEPTEVSVFVSACDVVCAPYKEILTSGTAMLALTFGRPVVSIDRGFLRDVIKSSSGILIDPQCTEELGRAMMHVKSVDWNPVAIRSYARTLRHEIAAAIFRDKLVGFFSEPHQPQEPVQTSVKRELN